MAHPTLLDLTSRIHNVAKKKNWIQAGDKHPGLFAKKAKEAGKTTAEYAEEKSDAPGKLGKEARFAQNAMRAHRLYSRGK
jgi:hypothetical protein